MPSLQPDLFREWIRGLRFAYGALVSASTRTGQAPMSYLRKLDQARARLGEGNLLAAEHELREATHEWKRSRVRAPLVEKGLEPALRTLGRVFGRKSDEPVLPVFARRAELLREDLHAFARSLAAEVMEDVARDDIPAERRHAQATEALTLQRSSEYFDLPPAREWEVVKVWLRDSRRLGSGIRTELLPNGPAPDGDERWWLDWLEEWCAEPVEPVRPFADWGRRLALHYGARDDGARVDWAWVQARLAIMDPLSAPLALAPLEFVLDAAPDVIAADALECWAGLVTNLRLLASPGGNARDVLEPRAMQAARLGIAWPPAEVGHRIPERRPAAGAVQFVSVEAQDDGTAIALVLHDGRRACDVLCIKPSGEPDPSDPFAMDESDAQRRIAAWLPPDAVLLSAGEPGPRLRGLVGSAKWIPVRALSELFGCAAAENLPAAPASSHPAWSREICAPWDTLIPSARRLVPALEDLFAGWPSLATGWGRSNLRRIGSRGVTLAEALADAAELFPAMRPTAELVESAPPLSLVWPRLQDRAWPRIAPRRDQARPRIESGRVWIDRRAGAEELAAVAAAEGATNLLCVGNERTLQLAEAAGRATDPAQVAVLGPEIPCLAPLLDLLNRWVTESPGDLERGRSSVWLLALLGESVGPVEPLLESCTDPELVDAVRERLGPCAGGCSASGQGGCWPEQAKARVREAHVTVVDVTVRGAAPPVGRRAVMDDLRGWVAGVDDEEAMRRLAWLPTGAESVVVFTPGMKFLVSLLGNLPACEGGDGGWRFVSTDTDPGPAVWSAPPGYGPSCRILAREARSLVEERARRWNADVGSAPLWGEGLEGFEPPLEGVASSPAEHATVLVPSLGGEGARSPLLLGLRLAAAASHARERVVCLSPVLAEVLNVPGGLLHGDDDSAVPRALDTGSGLLGGKRGRPQTTWTSPLTRPRLEQVGARRAREISSALHRWAAGRGRVLAGVLEGDREALVDLIGRLQTEALDGGPLGVRSVVRVVRDAGAEAGSSPELRLRALDRGRRLRVTLAVSELGDPAVEDWARRNPAVAWVFPHAECLLDHEDPESAHRLFAALRRSQARALFFTDHVGDARRLRDRINPHFVIDAVTAIDEFAEGLDPAGWELRGLGGLPAQCPECARSILYRRAFDLCPDCGVPVDSVASVRRSLRIAFETRIVEALRESGPQAAWTLIVFDAGRRSRLRQRLGLDGHLVDEAPLLSGATLAGEAEVIVPEDLWRVELPSHRVIVAGLPAELADWTLVSGRLAAMGIDRGEWWLGPAGLDESEALPGADADLTGRRERLLEGYGDGDRIRATSMLRRLEAAGGSWEGTSALRVHELARSGQADDAPLAALAGAAREGLLPAGTVTGLVTPPPARLERAVRSGSRLRPDPRSARPAYRAPGAIVGIAGFGKTARLVGLARECLSRHEPVLVLVPRAVGRLEWVERLDDPGLACLDFDEFLLDLVSDASALPAGLRLLPSPDLRYGEEVRLELSQRVSELYAARAGELPGVDSRSIVRALEGERLAGDPVAARSNVDYLLLQECVDRARAEGGWTDSRELLRIARASIRGDRVAPSFAAVLVDDAHDLPDSALDFLRHLFGSRLIAWSIDPVLGLVPEALVSDASMESHRFGPEIADAIERVWRATTPLPAPVRGLAPGRGVAESERILALTTATERIAEELSEDEGTHSIAIVAASERDRRMMSQQLSMRAIAVDSPDRDLVDLVTGPREVLAALGWIASGGGAEGADLLGVVIAAGPEPACGAEAEHYEARMRRRVQGEEVEVLDRVEAFLLPLVAIRGALGPDTRVESAVQVLLDCGLLQRLTAHPGMSRRIENFVRQYRGLTVAELLDAVPVERVLRPATGGRAVRILAPDQLAGRVFDRVHYICTGFEPPARHYRVISCARSAVKITCSEVDPLQG